MSLPYIVDPELGEIPLASPDMTTAELAKIDDLIEQRIAQAAQPEPPTEGKQVTVKEEDETGK